MLAMKCKKIESNSSLTFTKISADVTYYRFPIGGLVGLELETALSNN
jgi:hypothetical protein